MYLNLVTAIKFLVDEGSYKYVMSGSLLGVELDDLRSVPVGYMDEIEMYPLDLLEFFRAIGISTEVIGHLRTCFEERKPVDDFVHRKMLEAIRLYLIVGGMPAAVQKYLGTPGTSAFEQAAHPVQTFPERCGPACCYVRGKFCQENVQVKDKVVYYPIYMISFLEQMQSEEKVYKFDLTGL